MQKDVRLLIIEDVEDHALLLVRELHKAGFKVSFVRVETLPELEAALDAGGWDAIIADFNLPGFDGIDSLRLVQRKGVDIPFLLVSGAIGEEKAAEVMKAGAHDYIRKGNYARLAPTLERELKDAKVRKERRQTAEELSRYREHLEELVEERTAELVQVNQALQQEKQEREQVLLQLQAVLENIKEGVIISDLDGKLLMVNKEALALHQFRAEEVLDCNAADVARLCEVRYLSGDKVPLDDCPLTRALRGEAFGGVDLEVLRKDTGKTLVVSYSGTRVHNKLGEPILAVITLHDITERRRAEEAVRKSEYKFSKIFNTVPSLISIASHKDGRIIELNESALQAIGQDRDEVVGRTLSEIGVVVDQAEFDSVMQQLQEQGTIRNFETRFRGKGGALFTGLFSVDLITLDDQQYTLTVVRDITERKRAEEEIERLNRALAARIGELEESNQDLEAFNRIVSHDLRQPLNSISLACQGIQLLSGQELPQQCELTVETALDGVQRMNGMIEALLEFSRSTHQDVTRESVDLGRLANDIMAELRQSQPERSVAFEGAEGLIVDGDRVLLQSVLENLLGNAWKYTASRSEARIEFGTVEIGGERTFFVRDNGIGFDGSEAATIFTPFTRLSEVQHYSGFGIGLATVQRIIRRHGGRVWAEGEVDKGATFYFTLPPASALPETTPRSVSQT